MTSRISGFYRLSVQERRDLLGLNMGQDLTVEAADQMIENTIGVMGLPLGVALNFIVDGEPVIVPMATEEPSIIAASSYIAKLVMASGGFHTHVDEPIMMGQIQLLDVNDLDRAQFEIQANENQLVEYANQFCVAMKERGGGCVGVNSRILPGPGPMLVIDVLINCCDAMGANIVNTVVEGLGPEVARLTGGRLGFQILSNLSDRRLAKACCEVPYRALAMDLAKDNGREIAVRMVDGYRFACCDIYRACTHNKGIMNGIDALVIATGNDWRAVEAGAHAYASRNGRYTSLSHYELDDEHTTLKCSLELPMAIGVVGGSTRHHPTVVASLNLLGAFGKSAQKLAGLMAAVGLAQNMGALKALASEGIQRGHMALHSRKANVP